MYYWKCWTNYLDVSRLTLFLLYCFFIWFNDFDHMNSMEAVVIALSWLRGITYFRIFEPTRYLINLLYEVIFDVIPFMMTLTFSTTAFSVILAIMEGKNGDFFPFVTQA